MKVKATFKKIYKKYLVKDLETPEFLNPVFQKMGEAETIQNYIRYGSLVHKRVKTLKMESAPGTAETVVSMLKDLNKSKRVLDYGCGEHESRYIKALGFSNVVSADILNLSGENFVRIDPRENSLPFKDGEFDVVVASEVVEHVDAPLWLIKELVRISRDFVIVSTPNVVSDASKGIFVRSNFLHWFQPKDFSYHISPVFYWQIEQLCIREGWKLAELQGNHEIFYGEDENFLSTAETIIAKITH